MGMERLAPILNELRSDARLTLATISRKTGIPSSTVFVRLQELQKEGVIKRYVSLLNYERLGYPIRVHAHIRSNPVYREGVRSFLTDHQNVNTLTVIEDGHSYLADLLFASLRELNDFLETLQSEYDTTPLNAYHVVETLKEESFNPFDAGQGMGHSF